MGIRKYKPLLVIVIFICGTLYITGCTKKDAEHKSLSLNETKTSLIKIPDNATVLPPRFIGQDIEVLFRYLNGLNLNRGEFEKSLDYTNRVKNIIEDNTYIAIDTKDMDLEYNANSESFSVRPKWPGSLFSLRNSFLSSKTVRIDDTGKVIFTHHGVKLSDFYHGKDSFHHTFNYNIDKAKNEKGILKIIYVVKLKAYDDKNLIIEYWEINNEIYPERSYKYTYFYGSNAQIWVYNIETGEIINKFEPRTARRILDTPIREKLH
jgi:hypothetical protein